jgi:radical SAM superfamily enzyme YgiQ (UPF0313 family)
MKAYLADLDHYRPGNRISIPLGIGYIKSYCIDKLPDATINLYRKPEILIADLAAMPVPDVLGLSCYVWNTKLNQAIIKFAKQRDPKIWIVAGGPNANLMTEADTIVTGPGEWAFCEILKDSRIPEIAGEAVFGVPSPYLNGYLDEFLKEGLLPTFETVRGCPYSCTYCGGSLTKPVVVRDENTVYEELEYIAAHATCRQIDLIDTNFGSQGKRDLRIAKRLAAMYEKTGFPYIAGWATSKKKGRPALGAMRTIAGITKKLYLGVQTLTDSALKACKRVNAPLAEVIRISKQDNIPVHADLIFGLPTETKQSFLQTLDELTQAGVEGLVTYQLRLLPNTELADKQRYEYGYQTKYRILNNRWGNYIFGKIVETEEVAVSSRDFSFEDYLAVRRIGFLASLCLEYGAFANSMALLLEAGGSAVDLLEYISNQPIPIFDEYDEWAKKELYDNDEDVQPGSFKINLGFTGRCLIGPTDILDGIADYIYLHLAVHNIPPQRACAALESDRNGWLCSADSPYRIIEYDTLVEVLKDSARLPDYEFYEAVMKNAPRVSLIRRKEE